MDSGLWTLETQSYSDNYQKCFWNGMIFFLSLQLFRVFGFDPDDHCIVAGLKEKSGGTVYGLVCFWSAVCVQWIDPLSEPLAVSELTVQSSIPFDLLIDWLIFFLSSSFRQGFNDIYDQVWREALLANFGCHNDALASPVIGQYLKRVKENHQKQHLQQQSKNLLQQLSWYSRTLRSMYSSKTRIDRMKEIIREPKAIVPKWYLHRQFRPES